jgi:putative DNA primase/helicase
MATKKVESALKKGASKTHAPKRDSKGAEPQVVAAVRPLTDLGNAERFINQHGDKVRYCPDQKAWFVYRDGRWVLDNGAEVNGMAHDTIRSIPKEADQEGFSTQEKEAIRQHALKSASRGRILAMLELAKWSSQITVRPSQFDADPWLINCTNGTLDLRAKELRSHQPGDLITKMVQAPFDPKASCPAWKKFLSMIMGGKQDKVGFLQRVVGYGLTGQTSEQCLFVFHGPGANGKSTFMETLREVLGEYAMHATISSLLHSRSTPIRNDLARLNSARFVSAVEVGIGKRLDEALIKQLTGGDQVTVRFLFKEYFEFRPQFKIFIAANHRPEIRGVDHGIWRRIILIPFDRILKPEEIDKDLPSKLRGEMAGILTWAVQGCLEWQKRGLDVPESIKMATQQYRADMDILENFITDRCHKIQAKRVPVGDLYDAYKDWSQAACQDVVGKKVFGDLMRQKSYGQIKSGSTRFWKGLEVIQ